MMEPLVAFSRPTMRRPIVVLPQPDSPTIPNVWPGTIAKLASATCALTLSAPTCAAAPQ